jgi:hypothetical protein
MQDGKMYHQWRTLGTTVALNRTIKAAVSKLNANPV